MRRSRCVAPRGENWWHPQPGSGLGCGPPPPIPSEPQLSAIGLQPWQKRVNMFTQSESLWTPLKGPPGLGFPGAAEGVGGLLPSRRGSPFAWAAASSQAVLPFHRAAPSATQITVVLPHSSRQLLYLGTESGNVFAVQLPAFRALEDRAISSDAVLQG